MKKIIKILRNIFTISTPPIDKDFDEKISTDINYREKIIKSIEKERKNYILGKEDKNSLIKRISN